MRDSQERPHLTVKDLLGEPELGLILLAGRDGLNRQVGGVHISEMTDPTPWMAPRDVLLTTGLGIRADSETEFVKRLSQAGISALAIGSGFNMEHVSPGLRESADAFGLPLLEVAYEVPFRTITSYIFTSLLSTDMHRLRRSLSVQNHLLSLMVEDKGTDHLVSSLSMLLSATSLLFDSGGRVVSQALQKVRLDGAQTERIWHAYQTADRDGELPRELAMEDLRLVFREVRLHGRRHSVLALALPGREHLSEFADVVLTYAQKLLALELLKSRDGLLLQRKMQGDLLDELLLGTEEPGVLEPRLAAFQLDSRRDLLVAVLEVMDLTQDLAARGIRGVEQVQEARNELQDAVERILGEHRAPAIIQARGDAVLLLFQPARGPEIEPRALGLAVKASVEGSLGWPRLAVGISDAFLGLEGVSRALAQAREAVRLARTGRQAGVALFGELGPSIRFLENQSLDQLTLFYESTVRPLELHDTGHGDELLPTLRTYLEERRSVSRAARRLFIHENTLRYRLKKIEHLLDLDLGETESLVDLYLGLRSGTIILGRGSTSPGGPGEG